LNLPKGGLISQYESFFQSEGIEVVFKDAAIKSIAQAALKSGSGARGLKSVIDRCLLDVFYYVSGRAEVKRCIIDKETIEQQAPPILLTETGMPVALKRNQVFISYSRKDNSWLDDLKTMLSPLLRNKTIDIWFDGAIKPSQEWRKEIQQAMSSAKAAV